MNFCSIPTGPELMCVPKRTSAQQGSHDAAMRAINRGRRSHPRHHTNLVLPALTVAGFVVCLSMYNACAVGTSAEKPS